MKRKVGALAVATMVAGEIVSRVPARQPVDH